MVSASTVLAALIGAAIAGGGRLISDWRTARKTRISYITAIKTEANSISNLISSQSLSLSLNSIIQKCEDGNLPKHRISYDLAQDYFYIFHSLGENFQSLKSHEAEVIVSFYIIVKTAVDTLKVGGPLERASDPLVLAQNCRFLISIIKQIDALNGTIQSFPQRRKLLRGIGS